MKKALLPLILALYFNLKTSENDALLEKRVASLIASAKQNQKKIAAIIARLNATKSPRTKN